MSGARAMGHNRDEKRITGALLRACRVLHSRVGDDPDFRRAGRVQAPKNTRCATTSRNACTGQPSGSAAGVGSQRHQKRIRRRGATGSNQRRDRAVEARFRSARDPSAGALPEGCQVSPQCAQESGVLGTCRATGER